METKEKFIYEIKKILSNCTDIDLLDKNIFSVDFPSFVTFYVEEFGKVKHCETKYRKIVRVRFKDRDGKIFSYICFYAGCVENHLDNICNDSVKKWCEAVVLKADLNIGR